MIHVNAQIGMQLKRVGNYWKCTKLSGRSEEREESSSSVKRRVNESHQREASTEVVSAIVGGENEWEVKP